MPLINAWQGIRILDLSRVLARPWCTQTLAGVWPGCLAGVAVADFFGADLDRALAEARKKLSGAA